MNAGTHKFTANAQFHPGPIFSVSGVSIFNRSMKVLRRWGGRARQRRHLAQLTPRQLDDVGIGFKAAAAEAAKPFWQA